MRSRQAATLIEVLLAAVLGLSFFAILIAIFLQLGAAGRMGGSRIDAQLRARQAARRVVPYLRFATPPNTAAEAIYYPDQDTTASNVVFAVPEDLLKTATPFDPRNPSYYLYQIRHDSASKKLILEEFYSPTSATNLAIDIAAFNVTRIHLGGLVLRLRTESTARDARGYQKVVPYEIEEAVEVPH